MKLFKTLALTACLVLMASTAFGAAREVRPGLVQGEGEVVVLFNIAAAELTTSGHCLNTTGGVSTLDSAACEDPALNEFVVGRAVKVTNLRVTVVSTGQTGYICDFLIEIDGSTTNSTTLTTAASAAEMATYSVGQNLVVPAGSGLGIMAADGTNCGGSTKAAFSVQVEGYYLD
jgi:hypothetical protein